MTILIIVIVIGIMLAAILLSSKRISREEYPGSQRKDINVSQEKKANFFKDDFRPEYRQGKEFKIAGINNVPPFQTFGDFEGYVKPDVNNKYDEYAISIHSKYNDELVGYLPRSESNKRLFEAMLKQDAALYASGYISDFTDEQGVTRLYGRIYLDIQ